jgi:hypothetical protein
MRYLLLIYTPESTEQPPADAMQAEMDAYNAFGEEVGRRGVMRGGEALHPTSTATTVRVRDGETVVQDGPYAETKEALGGYYLLDCRDLDEAIELAARIPGARHGAIEVRPIFEFAAENVPDTVAAGAAKA